MKKNKIKNEIRSSFRRWQRPRQRRLILWSSIIPTTRHRSAVFCVRRSNAKFRWCQAFVDSVLRFLSFFRFGVIHLTVEMSSLLMTREKNVTGSSSLAYYLLFYSTDGPDGGRPTALQRCLLFLNFLPSFHKLYYCWRTRMRRTHTHTSASNHNRNNKKTEQLYEVWSWCKDIFICLNTWTH